MSLPRLTPRETTVMDLLIKHGCNKLIARDLGIAVRTVESILINVKEKFGERDRVVIAVKWATKDHQRGKSA